MSIGALYAGREEDDSSDFQSFDEWFKEVYPNNLLESTEKKFDRTEKVSTFGQEEYFLVVFFLLRILLLKKPLSAFSCFFLLQSLSFLCYDFV